MATKAPPASISATGKACDAAASLSGEAAKAKAMRPVVKLRPWDGVELVEQLKGGQRAPLSSSPRDNPLVLQKHVAEATAYHTKVFFSKLQESIPVLGAVPAISTATAPTMPGEEERLGSSEGYHHHHAQDGAAAVSSSVAEFEHSAAWKKRHAARPASPSPCFLTQRPEDPVRKGPAVAQYHPRHTIVERKSPSVKIVRSSSASSSSSWRTRTPQPSTAAAAAASSSNGGKRSVLSMRETLSSSAGVAATADDNNKASKQDHNTAAKENGKEDGSSEDAGGRRAPQTRCTSAFASKAPRFRPPSASSWGPNSTTDYAYPGASSVSAHKGRLSALPRDTRLVPPTSAPNISDRANPAAAASAKQRQPCGAIAFAKMLSRETHKNRLMFGGEGPRHVVSYDADISVLSTKPSTPGIAPLGKRLPKPEPAKYVGSEGLSAAAALDRCALKRQGRGSVQIAKMVYHETPFLAPEPESAGSMPTVPSDALVSRRPASCTINPIGSSRPRSTSPSSHHERREEGRPPLPSPDLGAVRPRSRSAAMGRTTRESPVMRQGRCDSPDVLYQPNIAAARPNTPKVDIGSVLTREQREKIHAPKTCRADAIYDLPAAKPTVGVVAFSKLKGRN